MKITDRFSGFLNGNVWPFTRLSNLEKSNKFLKDHLFLRPALEEMRYGAKGPQVQIPYLDITYTDMLFFIRSSPVLRTCLFNLRREVFRRGYEWQPKFNSKCTACGEEYEKMDPDGKCDKCDGKLRGPNEEELTKAKEMFECMNFNGQNLLDVAEQFEDDLNGFDDGYLIIRKEYFQDDEGNIILAALREIIRGSPMVMRIVADERGNLGGKWWVCLQHREERHEESKKCPKCGRKMYPVHYVSERWETRRGDIEEVFVEGEVFHRSKYSPSLLYGYSPVITAWRVIFTLIMQEQMLTDWYQYYRNPRQVLMAVCKNRKSLLKAWDKIKTEVQKNPLHVPLLAIESDTGKGELKSISLMDKIAEMQLIETRDEFRRVVAAQWGVAPIFLADISTSGGLNNEGLQITVTNRAVESGQKIYNEAMFPFLINLFEINEWKLVLLPSEEKDEMAELQREAQKVQIAQMMATLGFDVDRDPEGEFTYTKVGPATFSQQEPGPEFGGREVSQVTGLPEGIRSKSLGKEKVYLEPGEEPPKGVTVHEGDKGGRFYYSDEKPGTDVDTLIDEAKKNPFTRSALKVYGLADELYAERRDPNEIEYRQIKHDTTEAVEALEKIIDNEGKGTSFDIPWVRKAINVFKNKIDEFKDYKDLIFEFDTVAAKIHDIAQQNPKDSKILGEHFVELWNKRTTTHFMDAYQESEKEIEKVDDELVKEFWDKASEAIMAELWKNFKNLTQSQEKQVRKVLIEYLKGGAKTGVREIQEELELMGLSKDYANLIIRTEENVITNKARELAFKEREKRQDEEFKYKWSVVIDKKTSDICQEINTRVASQGRGHGVKLDSLKEIIRKTVRKHTGKNPPGEFRTHPNCRSTLVRVV